jgi:hypothetical protein
MRLSIYFVAAIIVALVLGVSAAEALQGKTITELKLRTGPNAKYELIVIIPPETPVYVPACAGSYCQVEWNGYRGFGRASALQRTDPGPIDNDASIAREEPEIWPIYPPYPYRAGHYPKADWYYDMPPYTAISPSFYRKRFFMMAQERNRYRYMPHIFHGTGGVYGDGGGPIEDVDIQGVAASLAGTYAD